MSKTKQDARSRANAPMLDRVSADRQLAEESALNTGELRAQISQLQEQNARLRSQNEALRAAQRELSQSRDHWSAHYEKAPVGYITLDSSRRIITANLRAAELLGYEREALLGSRLEDYFVEPDRSLCREHIESPNVGSWKSAEFCRQGGADAPCWLSLASFPYEDDQTQRSGWRVALHDVTHFMEAQRSLLEANRALEVRAAEGAGVAHLFYQVAEFSNRSEAADDVVLLVLRQLVDFHGYSFGHAFRTTPRDADEMQSMCVSYSHDAQRYDEFRKLSYAARFRRAEGLVGEVLVKRRPMVHDNLKQVMTGRRAGVAQALGFHTAVLFPVLEGESVAAVIELFANKDVVTDQAMLSLLIGIGTQIGRVFERERFARQLSEAVLAQQRRVAIDLHDTVGQELAGLALSAANHSRRLRAQDSAAADVAEELADGIRHALGGVRLAVQGLMPLGPEGYAIEAALHRLTATAAEQSGVDCRFESCGRVSTQEEVMLLHLYRIAAEALTNATKHSRAKHILVRLESAPDRMLLQVTDDGIGIPSFARLAEGMGLRIMRSRATAVGGRFSVLRLETGGTMVSCEVSLSNGNAHE